MTKIVHECSYTQQTKKQFHTFLKHKFAEKYTAMDVEKLVCPPLRLGRQWSWNLRKPLLYLWSWILKLLSEKIWRGTSYMVWGGFKLLESQAVLKPWHFCHGEMTFFHVCFLLIWESIRRRGLHQLGSQAWADTEMYLASQRSEFLRRTIKSAIMYVITSVKSHRHTRSPCCG